MKRPADCANPIDCDLSFDFKSDRASRLDSIRQQQYLDVIFRKNLDRPSLCFVLQLHFLPLTLDSFCLLLAFPNPLIAETLP